MLRIAYLRILRFQIVVHQKRDNQKGKPFALVTGKLTSNAYSRARIFMCSTEASRNGVVPGMRVSEAKAACADLLLSECDDALYQNAKLHLLQELTNCSPKVTAHRLGEFSLDASGLSHLGGESRFCRNVLRCCALAGYVDARIGIADSTFTAQVASRSKRKLSFIVPKGEDKVFMAPLSIRHLELDQEIEEALLHLGVNTMQQLVDLPAASVIERFGEVGKLAHNLAQGIDLRQPHLPEPSKEFNCVIDMGGAISSLNQTLFAFKSLLDQLTSALQENGLWAEELTLQFFNEDEKFNERTLRLIRPSNNARFLLEVIRLSIEAEPLLREFTKIKLCISHFTNELWEQNQIDLPTLSSVATENNLTNPLILLLQRFLVRFKEHKAVKPIASDHYDLNHAGAWVPVVKNNHADAIIPIDLNHITKAGHELLAPDFVLRKCRPISQVIVQLQGKFPTAINHRHRWYRVKHITTPEHLSGDWWEEPFAKTYYKVLVEPFLPIIDAVVANKNFLLMLLVHDQQKDNWFVEGFFD